MLIRTKDGKYKIVQHGELVAYQPSVTVAASIMTQTIPHPNEPTAPLAPRFAKTTAAFYMHPDDEEEIRRHEEKVQMVTEEESVHEIDPIITGIVSKHNLTFPDDVLRKRFWSIASSRLTQMRDSLETHDALTRPAKVGGMGYDEVLSQNILSTLEQESSNIHDTMQSAPRSHAPEPPAGRPTGALEQQPMRPTIPQALARPVQPLRMQQPEPRPVPLPQPIMPPVRSVDRPVPQMPRVMRETIMTERQPVVDIRRPTRVVGPVEELSVTSVEDFRKLGRSLEEQTKKMLQKFDLLADESLLKKADGITAWHTSPMYQLYVDVGRESIESGKSIADVVAGRAAASKPTIAAEEFYAIADMNKRLRF